MYVYLYLRKKLEKQELKYAEKGGQNHINIQCVSESTMKIMRMNMFKIKFSIIVSALH